MCFLIFDFVLLILQDNLIICIICPLECCTSRIFQSFSVFNISTSFFSEKGAAFMDEFTILHLSDLHISTKYLADIKIVLNGLFADLDELRKEGHSIDFICFTGDLIAQGKNASTNGNQLELALEHFILPLLDKLDLKSDSFYIVPGNHEVNTDKIEEYTEIGIKSKLISRDNLNLFYDGQDYRSLDRISYFDEFVDLISTKPIWKGPLSSSYIAVKGNTKIGIVCLNSAWRSVGCGESEIKNLLVGERQIDFAYQNISNCDIKIALIHHPTSWLMEYDQKTVERLLRNFDIVLSGHMHNLKDWQSTIAGQTTFCNSCGALFQGRIHNGYSLIKVDPHSRKITSYMREWIDNENRRTFDKALSRAPEGKSEYFLTSPDKLLESYFSLSGEDRKSVV